MGYYGSIHGPTNCEAAPRIINMYTRMSLLVFMTAICFAGMYYMSYMVYEDLVSRVDNERV